MDLSLFSLLTAPITFPCKGLKFILEVIQEQVDRELLSIENIHQKLREVEVLHEIGEISTEEYIEVKEYLIQKLHELKEMNAGD